MHSIDAYHVCQCHCWNKQSLHVESDEVRDGDMLWHACIWVVDGSVCAFDARNYTCMCTWTSVNLHTECTTSETYVHVHLHTHKHVCIHRNTPTKCMYMCMNMYMNVHTCAHAHHMHACMCAHTRTWTHMHAHSHSHQMLSRKFWWKPMLENQHLDEILMWGNYSASPI